MKKVIIFMFFAISIFSMEKDKYENVISLIQNKNYSEAFKNITELKKTSLNDPEYYALIINYYFSKSMSDGIIVRKGEPTQEKYLSLYDSTSSKPIGVIEGQTTYNMDTLNIGLKEFEIGLSKFPNRLDLHFGLIHAAFETNQYSLMQNKMLFVIQLSKEIDNDWLWSFNEKYSENNEEDFLNAIQEKLFQLFQKQEPNADSVLVNVSKSLISNYPNCIYGYNNLGAIYTVNNDYESAKRYFEKALKINNGDIMVLANLANISIKQGLKSDALKYCNKLIEVGDDETAKWAKEQLEMLNNN